MTASEVKSPEGMAEALKAAGYLPDDGLATVAFLAYEMRRPLFLEGAPGVGKTEFARALATVTGTELLQLQCYEGIDRRQALYDWNFPKQMLHLRAVHDAADAEGSLWERDYLLTRPIARALETPATLLIDEIDRADDEFEAFLLEALAHRKVSIPEAVFDIEAEAGEAPWVVITSNRTREVHDALKRRCFYHWMEHPSLDREVAIVRRHVPGASATLIEHVTRITAELRKAELQKPPGVAETIDWVTALCLLAPERVSRDLVEGTLGIVLKLQEDIEFVRKNGILKGW